MNYFSKTEIVFSQKEEASILYIMLPSTNDTSKPPMLTKEILSNCSQYRPYEQKNSKGISIVFEVYQTEATVNAATHDEAFESLILNQEATKCSSGELFIEAGKRSVKKRKKSSPAVTILIVSFAVIVSAFVGILVGGKLNGNTEAPPAQQVGNTNVDGMIVPEQSPPTDAEQITISIDRSYAAVPTEDLQLKGAVVDGVAQIELPRFDKEDFFNHVSGYTWGFSSIPDGKKIEYYGGQTYSFTSDTKLYRVLVKYGGGSGTKDDPYLIDYYDQLELMAEEKARGYFKQTADILFPTWATHKPIDTVNELKANPDEEYFEYDGNGFIIQGIDNPLFGTVSGAVIRNVNICNAVIQSLEYDDYGFIVRNALNYRYKTDHATYETGATLIQHCTVSHASIIIMAPETENGATTVATTVVVPPDLIEYDENGNIIESTTTVVPVTKIAEHAIGAISGNGGQIEGCYVTDFGIFVNGSEYILYAGGISGKPASVKDSAVYYYSTQGRVFHAGGIVGSAEGARLYDATGKELPVFYGGTIQGCLARNIILTTEMSAGGIAGVGSSMAENAIISNSYANELYFTCGEYSEDSEHRLLKAGITGGVIGLDGTGKYGHLVSNTVSLTDFPVIGQRSLSSYDDTVRLAPSFAFYQESILSVLNKNTVHPQNPQEMFTGTFMFGENSEFGDESGNLCYPASINDLFIKTVTEEQ